MARSHRFIVAALAVSLVFAGAAGTVLFLSNDSGISPQRAQAQERLQNRGITVQGEGQISVAPDVANVVLGVELEGTDLDSMRDDADSRMNDVVDALIDLGIAEEDIRTTTYDIRIRDRYDRPIPPPMPEETAPDEPVSDDADDSVTDEDAVTEEDADTSDDAETSTSDAADEDDAATDAQDTPTTTEEATPGEGETSEPGVTTYVVLQQVQVRISDIDMVGDVIDTALDAGANRVSNIWFEVEDRQGAIDQAREQAVASALQKAEHLAELTGVSLGTPLYIDEWSPSGAPIPFAEQAIGAADDADEAMARIQPGESIITVTVNITYEIQ